MQFSIREARQKLSHLLKAVEQGEEVEITRRGRVVARLTSPREQPKQEPGTIAAARATEREALRNSLPPARTSAADLIRELRDERG
ncbi:type II toxin-antitoxin system Phd/YefM family antitoxin [Wenzhouxiangella sp. EGI_FJ10409]|uniref:type II toxin-antitoxin system Phd/YefM family antitoxin n=1 Tax=Wenzhouxiangella sp. EGI_FJ10409 TaxID=3243767 RepID=UPI0035DD32FC